MKNKIKKENIYTVHGRVNTSTKKPYTEIKKNGKHYCYAPYGLFASHMKSKRVEV